MNNAQLRELPREDMVKYFDQTYMRASIPKDFEEQYIYIRETAENGDSLHIRVDGKDLVRSRLDIEFKFDFPEIGMYNSTGGPVYILRRPRRQNKKGICMDTLWAKHFNSDLDMRLFGHGYFKFSCDTLNQAFINTFYPTWEKAKSLLGKKGLVSIALDKTWVLSLGIWSKTPTLWYRTHPVGEYHEHAILVKDTLFFQEVKDTFGAKVPVNVGQP
jgi:hypothetical protein